jgi:acetyl-CoA carboxylase biotin carboxyl carrier protein
MTNEKSGSLTVLAEFRDAQYIVLSPTVGNYSAMPQSGIYLPGGSFVGRLKILNTFYDLCLPGDVSGLVVADNEKDFIIPVEYGQELFRLSQDKRFLESGDQTKQLISKDGEDAESAAGCVITAFTSGIFYAKPGPDSAPFVTLGQEIKKGKALGLIEVMKTFNYIVFHGTAKGDAGTIKKIYVKDSQEVKLGQPLFLID